MANFRPLKKYLIYLMDKFDKRYSFGSPFLDAGCGLGEISAHFADRGLNGVAIDISDAAIQEAKKNLSTHDNIRVEKMDIMEVSEKFDTIFLCDVLEHLNDDQSYIKHLSKIITENGKLIISVPILKNEWRWDDDFYGHIRRYEIPEIIQLLCRNGFNVMEIWDFTFPVFWLIRKIYTKIIPKKMILKEKHLNTKISARRSAWDYGILTAAVEKIIWWRPIFWLQDKFKNHLVGCECILIAQKINDRPK